MRKVFLSAVAAAAAFLAATSAQAGVVICGGTGQPKCPNVSLTNVLLTSGSGDSVQGHTQNGFLVTYTGNESLTANPNGQATVGATDLFTNYLDVVFAGGVTYAEFNIFPTSGNVENEATSVLITYYIGDISRTVTVDTNGENRMMIYDEDGATINRLTFATVPNTTTFQDLRQLRIVEAVAAPVPEPGTWAMMLLGFGAVGYGMRRRPTKTGTQIA